MYNVHQALIGRYDYGLVVLSALLAILASYAALDLASRIFLARGVLRAIWLTCGAAAMGLVLLPVILAIVISRIVLWLTFHSRDENRLGAWQKLASAFAMGLAIAIMHYTGMAASTFVPMASTGNLTHALEISELGIVVVSSLTTMVLGLTILTSLVDRKLSAQGFNLQRRHLKLACHT
jgi:two-component system, sensor histidine kinase and response regulator